MRPIGIGIDVSKNQGANFSLKEARNEGFEFAILRGGGSTYADHILYKDTCFEKFYSDAKSIGIPVGAYWVTTAMNESEAKAEARYFMNTVLKGKQFELPIFMDVEYNPQLSLGKRKLTEIVKTWLKELEKNGWYPGIYCTPYFFSSSMYDAELFDYPHWAAYYGTYCAYTTEKCLGFWQYGGNVNKLRSNLVTGVVCDQNLMYQNFPEIIKKAGKNGFKASFTPTKTVDEVAREVILGKWGVGTDRKKALVSAGYDYAEVQQRVNELLS